MNEKSIYQAFGFKGQQPLVAGIALYAVIIAPPLSAIFRLLINQTAHRTQFLVGKYQHLLPMNPLLTSPPRQTCYGTRLSIRSRYCALQNQHSTGRGWGKRLAILDVLLPQAISFATTRCFREAGDGCGGGGEGRGSYQIVDVSITLVEAIFIYIMKDL